MSQEPQFKEARPDMNKNIRWEEEQNYVVKDGQKVPANSVYLGNVITGEYLEKKEGVGDNGSNLYMIKLNEGSKDLVNGIDYSGKTVGLWGNEIFDDRFARGDEGKPIGIWSQVRITFLGMKQSNKNKSRQYRNFRVEFAAPRPPEMREAGAGEEPQY